jgi:peptidoglycan/LPS O-acetylase OafA/YrhL
MHKRRLYSLDALRTFAALAVVIGHWPTTFFSVGMFARPSTAAPFYGSLSEAYLHGRSAVAFFFCLSGFVFYWLYAEDVFARRVNFRRFSIRRISRLYPLHIATLVLLVPLLAVFHAQFGPGVISENNDLFHFLLNLGLVQYWDLNLGFSWNEPSWSVSVEIALYILFFLACRMTRPSALQAAVLMVAASVLAQFSIIATSAVGFFGGGLAYYAFLAMHKHRTASAAVIVIAMTFLVWVLLVPLTSEDRASSFVAAVRNAVPPGTFGDISELVARKFCNRVNELVLFPSLVFAVTFVESATPFIKWRALSGAGDISYGVYLLHFPLQLVFLCVAFRFSMPGDTFTQPYAFLAFFAVLIAIASANYRWLERPAMLALRGRSGALLSWPGVTSKGHGSASCEESVQ